jgi:hypothetical protein
VPKDIDALMSVLFGMAQGALTARHSLTTLKRVNRRKYRMLRQHAVSQTFMLPVIVVHGSISKGSTRRLIVAIQSMPYSSKGKEVLGSLGWNGWKKLSKADRQLLMGTSKK